MENHPHPLVAVAGLREMKKARTRQAISDVATRLFAERGFEAVTVAEIARAAEVSEKTVFNYFAAKEDLFFDRADELVGGLERTIATRAPGTTVTGALRALLADNRVPFPGLGWRDLRDPAAYERIHAYVATEAASPTLRARRLVMADAWCERLAAAAAEAWGLRPADLEPRSWARLTGGAMRLRERVYAQAVLERRSAPVVERRVRAAVGEAFGRIAFAYADVDR